MEMFLAVLLGAVLGLIFSGSDLGLVIADIGLAVYGSIMPYILYESNRLKQERIKVRIEEAKKALD